VAPASALRVARLHRIVARVYEQSLQTVGLSLPQMEILIVLTSATGPVSGPASDETSADIPKRWSGATCRANIWAAL
jgi:vacuolar-type H+-ATPase catalytic subunit A/Vma1